MRIALAISSLRAGGAERVMSSMASWWARRGNRVTLVTLGGSDDDFHRVDDRVARVTLGVTGESRGALDAARGNARRIRALRGALRAAQPDVVVSFVDITNVLAVAATRGMSAPLVISERTDPNHFPIGRMWTTLRRLAYPFAGALVVQSEGMRAWGDSAMRDPSRVVVIPNPVDLPGPDDAGDRVPPAYWRPDRRHVLAIGRLDDGKAFDLLLRAFSDALGPKPEWDLVIMGEGPARAALEGLRAELGLEDRVRLPGRVHDPWAVGRAADMLVLSSRFEGFPNVILEAMAHGVPPVSFDCPIGPRHILTDGRDGLLVPPGDVRGLAAAIGRVAESDAFRTALASEAARSAQRYETGTVMEQWNDLIARLTGTRPA